MAVVARGDKTKPTAARRGHGPGAVPSFAAVLNDLVANIHPPGQGPYSNQQIADGVVAVGGPAHDRMYYQQLRSGARANPSFELVVALALLFGVSLSEFAPRTEPRHDDSGTVPDSPAKRSKIRELTGLLAQVRRLDQLDAILAIVRSFLRSEPADES